MRVVSGKARGLQLKTIESENSIIKFNGDVNPIIIVDEKDDSLLQLILPIKTY